MTSSNFSAKLNPFCFKWDEAYESNYQKHNARVQNLEKTLETKKTSVRYPFFFQRQLIELELNQQMRELGEIFVEEFDQYQKINSSVRSDFSSAFQSSYSLPLFGLTLSTCAGLLFAFAPILKSLPNMKFATLLLPPLSQYVLERANTPQQLRAKEFLNWTLAYREAQSRLEFEGRVLFEKNPLILKRLRYSTLNRTSPYDIYDSLILMVRQAIPENDTGNITSFI